LNDYRHNTMNIMLHDFRNFTGSIQMSLDLLKNKSDNLSGEQKEIINYISTGNDKLNYLSEKLAASADRDEAKVEFNYENFDINPEIEKSVMGMLDAAQLKDINLQLHLSASVIMVYLDKLFLSQVLFKLLTNAIKYAQKDTILTIHSYEIDRISWMWKQIQRYFSGTGYENLYFEIYNEPTLSSYQWKETITTIVHYLRFEDANRIYIIGGTNYNNIDQLKEMGKISDNKLFYTIHFYEPYIFTHQGAEWTGNKSFITNIPYPYQKNLMPELLPELKGTSTEMDYNKYAVEGTDTFIKERFSGITQFCNINNMPLICTEAGVISLAEQQYRENYLTDITSVMNENGIQCVLWDYNDKFSIKESDKKVMHCLKNWLKDSVK